MAADRIKITEEGLASLKEELHELITIRRPEIVATVARAREEGDLRENAGYDAAKHDQELIDRRIRELEQQIKSADVISFTGGTSHVQIGSTVTVEIDGDEETYTIVGAVEARPREGRISNESPYGRALLGRRVGETVDIQAPNGSLKARVVNIA
jgi:transcription elongation factor GreA